MATSYRYVVYSVKEVFNQTFDDADISDELILFWSVVVSNKLRKLHVEKQQKKGTINGRFLSIFMDVPVVVHNHSDGRDEVEGRKHVHLPESIMQMDMDGGVDYIAYMYDAGCCGTPSWTEVVFSRTTPSESRRTYMNPHEKPTPENPYFYVVGNNIYLLGVECVAVRSVEMGLFTDFDPNTPCDMSEEVPLPEHLIEPLIAQLVNMGRFLLAFPKDRVNDGDDNATDGAVTGFDRRTLGGMKQVDPRSEENQENSQ